MFGKKKADNLQINRAHGIEELIRESKKILDSSKSNNLDVKLVYSNVSAEIKEVIDNINDALKNYKLSVDYDLMKYRLSNRAMEVGLWDMDVVDGDPVNPNNAFTWSDDFRRMLGFTSEVDFPNKLSSWSDRLHPEDKAITLRKFADHMTDRSGQTPYNLEYRLKMKGGEYRYFRALGTTMRDKQGVPIRVAGLIMDIHNEKMEREAQKQIVGLDELKSELLRMLDRVESNNDLTVVGSTAQLSPDLEYIMDIVNKIISGINRHATYQLTKFNLVTQASKIGLWDMQVVKGDPVNPANTFIWSDEFRRLVGYSNEADFPNILSSWSDKLHPEDKEATLRQFSDHLLDHTGRTPYDLKYRMLKKNGEYGYYHAFGATIRDKEGNALRVAGALEDITEQTNAAIQANTLDMRFKLLQKSISIALWDMVVDPDDPVNGDNEFWWSQEFRDLLGFSSESDFPNTLSSWSDRLHPEDKEPTLNAFAAHLLDRTGNTPYNVEYRVKRKTGEYIWLKADGSTLRTDDGTPIRVVGSVEDITNRLHKGELESHMSKFTNAIAEMTESIASIMSFSDKLMAAQKSNLQTSEASERDAAETKSIISSIKSVASQTSILGVNASIEAARAGEAGRGFKVVSDEISKLSKESKNSAELIERKLKIIQDSASGMTKDINHTTSLMNEQTATIAAVKKMVDDVNAMYTELVNIIKLNLS